MYRKPGFYTLHPSQVVLNAAVSIYNTGAGSPAGFELPLAGLIKTMGREARFIRTLTPTDLFMANDSQFIPGTRPHEAFTQFVYHWAYHMKLPFFTELPAHLEYTTNFRLTIDECADLLIASKVSLPEYASLGDDKATFETLRFALPAAIRSLQSLTYLRQTVISRLRLKLRDLGFRIAKGGELSQFEKSFFMCYADLDDPYARSSALGETASVGLTPLLPLENADPLVDATFEALKPLVEEGPSLKFLRYSSSANYEHLVAAAYPMNPNMEFNIAAAIRYGPYYARFAPRASETVRFDENQFMSATRQRITGPSSSTSLSPVPPTIVRSPSAGRDLVYDLPQVKLSLRNGMQSPLTASEIELTWPSGWRGRIVSTQQGFPASAIELDLLLKNKTLGDAQMGNSRVLDWSLVSTSSLARLQAAGKIENAPLTTPNIYVPYNGSLGLRNDIDLSVALQQTGFMFFRPAFSEFYRMGVESLMEPQPALEQAVIARMNLLPEYAEQARLAIRASLNAFLIERRFGAAAVPVSANPASGSSLANYCATISGVRNAVTPISASTPMTATPAIP